MFDAGDRGYKHDCERGRSEYGGRRGTGFLYPSVEIANMADLPLNARGIGKA